MICIVIPVHNRLNFTIECIGALHAQTYTDFKIIVVDDGSSDGTKDFIYRNYPNVSVLAGDGKLFWSAAVNMGIEYGLSLGADYILTLNNDGYPSPHFLTNMMKWAERKTSAIFCSYEIDAVTQQPYYGGERINKWTGSSSFLLDRLNLERRKGIHEVSVAPGRGMFIPRKVFEEIGLFKSRLLPHYMADYDFASQAKKHGFELYCNYDAVLYSYTGESGDKELIREKSLKNYFKHLFSIKGGGNLRNFTIYTLRNSPLGLIPFHLLKGYSQRIFGYLIK